LISFDELDHTDEESARIICVTSHSAKMRHKKYEKKVIFALHPGLKDGVIFHKEKKL